MNNKQILTLGTFKKDSNSNTSVEVQAKIEKVKQVISNTKNSKSFVKQNQSVNSQSKKLTPQAKKAKRQARYAATFKKLIEQYPKCFSATPRPLAIGIHKAIWEGEEKKPEEERISKTTIRHFLLIYTGSKAYREAIIAGGNRIDLQGNEMERVSTEHIEIAKQSLEAWNNKRAIWQQSNKLEQKK